MARWLLVPFGMGVSSKEDVWIVAPLKGTTVYGRAVTLRGDGAAEEVCWEMRGDVVKQTIGQCYNDGSWRIQSVALPSRGRFTVGLKAKRNGTWMETWTDFTAGVEPRCRQALIDREGVHRERYRAISSFDDSAADEYVNYDFAPVCYETWPSMDIRSYLATISASRGFFGVDCSAQEFGHGDRLVLDFLLSRHRVKNILEFGTFGGVTSLYLGMGSLLNKGSFHTFDNVDVRFSTTLTAWLPNMHFHLGDFSHQIPDVDLLVQADLVLVDHVNRLFFSRDVVAPFLSPGSILLVHDFSSTGDWGPENTLHDDWLQALTPLGLHRVYNDVASVFSSSLAVFLKEG